MKFNYTLIRKGSEIDIVIFGSYVPPYKGFSDGKYGPSLEPDEEAFFEIDYIVDKEGRDFEVTEEEFEEISEYGLDLVEKQHDYDDLDDHYERWVDSIKQEKNDVGFQWTIFIDGREWINGLTKREVPYFKKKALDKVTPIKR